MTFDKQVEKAKEEKLKYRITRDVIFIVLGITFLVISIFVSYSDSKKESNNTGKKTTTVVDKLKEIKKTVDLPVVAIGGLSLNNIDELKEANVDGYAVVSAILKANDIKLECEKWTRKIEELKN